MTRLVTTAIQAGLVGIVIVLFRLIRADLRDEQKGDRP